MIEQGRIREELLFFCSAHKIIVLNLYEDYNVSFRKAVQALFWKKCYVLDRHTGREACKSESQNWTSTYTASSAKETWRQCGNTHRMLPKILSLLISPHSSQKINHSSSKSYPGGINQGVRSSFFAKSAVWEPNVLTSELCIMPLVASVDLLNTE